MGSGGARKGAGRKPTEDKLIPYYMSVRQSDAEVMDDTIIRETAEHAVQLKANRIRKRNGQKG